MTRLEAEERARAIWGDDVLDVDGPMLMQITRWPSGRSNTTEWWVSTKDGDHHGLDQNGHTTCHDACSEREAAIGGAELNGDSGNGHALVAAAAEELSHYVQRPLTIVMRAAVAQQVAGLVLLGLQQIPAESDLAGAGKWFLEHVRAYFKGSPAVLELLRRGDPPS